MLREPDQAQVGDQEAAALAVIAFRVFDVLDRIDDLLARATLQILRKRIKTNLSVLPNELGGDRLTDRLRTSLQALHL